MADTGVANRPDPLSREVQFRHGALFFPYGFPVRIHTNHPLILRAAEDSWSLHKQQYQEDRSLEVNVGILYGEENGDLPLSPPVVRAMRHLLTITGNARNSAICDFETGYAHAWLTTSMLADLPALRFFYLDAMVYSLVCERYLTGIHASCVALHGRGVLLCGDSQAGKSTLAYACARRGFTYVSDDGSFLLRSASDRMVIGNPYSIRFRPSAVKLFPELSEFEPALRANGKMSLDIPTSRLPIAQVSTQSNVCAVLFLDRRDNAEVEVLPFSREDAMQRFEAVLVYGRDASIAEQRVSLRRVLEEKVLRMIYSDLASAVDAIESVLREAPCI